MAGTTDQLLFGTILHYIFSLKCCAGKRDSRRVRLKEVIEKTEEHLDRTLDIRNHLRLHSIVLAMVRVIFDTGDNDPAAHLSLLALQRKGKVFDVNEQADAAERLLYSGDDSINSDKTTNVEASDGIRI